MPAATALLEALLAPKRGLGGAYRFAPGMLEVKRNRHGISGVFTRHALGSGDEIISVPILNGSMTPFRAFEEAAGLLAGLGPDRFNVSQEFAIAAAIYLRATAEGAADDILVTEADLAAAYAGSPMTSYDSLARAELLNSNNRDALAYAAELDRLIDTLGVDAELFRAILGYISSRAWKGVGVIPVLDWFNACYTDGANCAFRVMDGRFCYVATKAVAAGEELLWNYNNANAVTTWLNYGYLDVERPTLAFLEIRIDASQRRALDELAQRELDLAPNAGASPTKVDACVFQRELLTPGQLSSDVHARKAVAACMKSFTTARAWFRMLAISEAQGGRAPVTLASINADELAFGTDVEAQALASMRAALVTGQQRLHERVAAFSRSAVGSRIDMTPYVEMADAACRTWDEALALACELCAAETADSAASTALAALGAPDRIGTNVGEALDAAGSRPGELIASVASRYLKAVVEQRHWRVHSRPSSLRESQS